MSHARMPSLQEPGASLAASNGVQWLYMNLAVIVKRHVRFRGIWRLLELAECKALTMNSQL